MSSLFVCVSTVRQGRGRPRGRLDSNHGLQPRTRPCRPAHHPPALVPKHLVVACRGARAAAHEPDRRRHRQGRAQGDADDPPVLHAQSRTRCPCRRRSRPRRRTQRRSRADVYRQRHQLRGPFLPLGSNHCCAARTVLIHPFVSAYSDSTEARTRSLTSRMPSTTTSSSRTDPRSPRTRPISPRST